MFLKKHFSSIILLIISLSFAFIGAEIFTRIYDGYKLTSLSLVFSAQPKKQSVEQKVEKKKVSPFKKFQTIAHHLPSIPLADSAEVDWFYQNPEMLPNFGQPQADIVKRISEAPPLHQYESSYVWNYYYIQQRLCKKPKHASFWKNYFFYNSDHQLYAYKPANKIPHPAFRFLPNRADPAGMVVNNVGFRGHDISIEKPKNTIRLAFLGSSTTVSSYGTPYSYPELVEYWLSLWANKTNFPYHIEVINAARSGISSPDIAQVALNEVLPLNPDYIFYYEGSNQFVPKDFLDYDHKKYQNLSSAKTFEVKPIEQYSAVAKRYYQMLRTNILNNGSEPKKPTLTSHWPADLDEINPDINYPKLPVHLNRILSDLDIIRNASAKQGVMFVPMSFVWLPYDGLQLEIPKHTSIYTYLNHSMWPFSYQWIRRMADFQNRIFKNYALEHQLNFIDIDKYMPRDPLLFTDGIHNTEAGIRVRGWIAFQQIAQLLSKNTQNEPSKLTKNVSMDNLESNIFMLSQRDIEDCTDWKAGDKSK